MENQIPSSPAELLAMQQGGVKGDIGHEGADALDDYIRGELFPEINPDMNQVLQLTKRLLEDLESYHFSMMEQPELSPTQRKIWKRDAKNVTKALLTLRQVSEC